MVKIHTATLNMDYIKENLREKRMHKIAKESQSRKLEIIIWNPEGRGIK